MLYTKLFTLLCAAATAFGKPSTLGGSRRLKTRATDGLQNIVTWDQYSYMINGERLFIFSGEVHPYRMPVQSLHLDVFQKIKAMGFNAVSFYTFWGMHEPKRGTISFEGFRDLQPFFDAAMEAGIYLIARPGPYINAETTAGGFPGWGTYTEGIWRTSNTSYVEAYQGYIAAMGAKLAAAQITNGGPVILVQVENEYSGFQAPYTEDYVYESELLKSFLDAGITVPTTTNDAWAGGHFLSVDVYGYDAYPNGFDCSHPTVWGAGAVPEWFYGSHMSYNPNDLNAVYEFQGGAFDGWGGSGYDTCAILTGTDFEKVFYKNELSMSTTYLNLYMIFGGTNWGGIAHPGVYTSYDYGSAIAEDRTLREKYYELKLQANFLKVSPAYLTSLPMNLWNNAGGYSSNPVLLTTRVSDAVGNKTSFYFVRQNDSSTFATEPYTLSLPTSAGTFTIPTMGSSLALKGKDSRIHVVDYAAGNTNVLYSTAEIMTWATIDGRDIILLYGDAGEVHETAISFTGSKPAATVVSGSGKIATNVLPNNNLALQFTTTGQTVVTVGSNVVLYILDRVTAYEFWVLHPATSGTFASFSTANPVIVKGGYLLRNVAISGSNLEISGDLNSTTKFEIIAPASVSRKVSVNGQNLSLKKTSYGTLLAQKNAKLPAVTLPHLSSLKWKVADSLPEVSASYSDALWVVANKTSSNNPQGLNTPVSLYAGDYGFHTGNILWRGHFTATGTETGINLALQGGAAFAFSVYMDSTFVGSWEGDSPTGWKSLTLNFPSALTSGNHVLTVLQDHMGYEEDWTAASDSFKSPRGIMSYSFVGSSAPIGLWKVTGNLGGEDFADFTRGPLNEGGLFAERQGWHQPGFDDSKWASGKPTTGISGPGVSFFRSTFKLDVPSGVDYPMSIVVSNSTTNPHFRSQFYVNGYQFGKYINHIGPQTSFPVPQGILNYKGLNTLAVSLWAAEAGGAKLNSLDLKVTGKLESAMATVVNQPQPLWTARANAY